MMIYIVIGGTDGGYDEGLMQMMSCPARRENGGLSW